jgi:hypothetical protein
MAEIAWHLLQPVDTGALTMQGFQTGMAMVKQVQSKNALRSYLANPDDPEAYNALAYYDPQAAATIQHGRFVQQKLAQDAEAEQQRRAILSQYVGGDSQGARTAAVSAGDFDLADHLQKLDADQQSKLASFYKLAGPLAYQMRQIQDPEQRKAFLAQARPALEAQGVDPKAIDSFDVTNDTALDALVAANSTVDQLIDRGKITWHQQGEQPSFATDSMGRPVGSQNPYAKGGAPSAGYYGGSQGNLTASQAWQFILPHEGGYAAHDGNGSPVNYGINQGANPDVDVGKLTPEKAQSLFEERYWKPSGADVLPAPLAAVHADTYFINPAKAKEILAASEGDPSRYMDLREQWLGSLAQEPKYARFSKAWASRNHDLREFAAEVGGGQGASSAVPTVSSKAEFDKLASGTVFMAPDGSRRVKP